MKYLLSILLALFATVVIADEPAESLGKDTAGVLLIILNDKPMGFVFISKTGQILPEDTNACQAKKECVELVRKLMDSGHSTTVQLGEQKERVT